MKSLITIALLSAVSPLQAHQWQVSEVRCHELAQGFATAQNLDGHLMHEYVEGCDFRQLPALMEQAIDAMEATIERERSQPNDAPGIPP